MSPEKVKLGRSSVQTTAESVASASTGALIKELQRHGWAHKASDEKKQKNYPGGVYPPVAVTAASLGEGRDYATYCLRVWFSFA